MSTYSEFFLNSAPTVKPIYTVEISHPNFSQSYFLVQNVSAGITLTLEDSASQAFVYYPFKMNGTGSNETLDQILEFQLGDLGELLPTELDNVAAAGGWQTKPTVKYRIYRSDDLTAPLWGPIILEVTTITFTREGAAFQATAPQINVNQTGEILSFDRFPMQMGFL